MAGSEQGYLLCSDITGYTAYLTDTELEHAQSTLTDLLNLMLNKTRPPLIVSRTAGDAVLSYAFDESFRSGQTVVELIEDCYIAFRRAIDLMVLNTTCTCNACRRIDTLDLKFFVHHGAFAIQRLDNHDELVGADVVVLHRLLKNSVVDQTGIAAYCLWTEAAITALGLEAMRASMVAHVEDDEQLGRVETWIQDLAPVWEARKDEPTVHLDNAKEIVRFEVEIAQPPEVVWDHLSDVESRLVLMGTEGLEVGALPGGRVGENATFVCFHGNGSETKQTIVEWRPFERAVSLDTPSVLGGRVSAYVLYELTPTEAGTRFALSILGAAGPPIRRRLMSVALKAQRKAGQRDAEKFRDHVEAAATTAP